MKKTINGDLFRIYITPPSTSFPWIQYYFHPNGIRKKGIPLCGTNATKKLSKEKLAREISQTIIDNSEILKKWYNY